MKTCSNYVSSIALSLPPSPPPEARSPANGTFQIPFCHALAQPTRGQHSENGSIRTGSRISRLDSWTCKVDGETEEPVVLFTSRKLTHNCDEWFSLRIGLRAGNLVIRWCSGLPSLRQRTQRPVITGRGDVGEGRGTGPESPSLRGRPSLPLEASATEADGVLTPGCRWGGPASAQIKPSVSSVFSPAGSQSTT